MNQFFDVGNVGRNAKGHFIIARDKEHAKIIASTENGKPTRVTKMQIVDNIQELIDSGETGILAKEIRAYTFNQVFGLEPKPEQPLKPWFFIKKVK